MTFAEGQRNHASIGAAGNGVQRPDAEMVEHTEQHFGLVVARYARESGAWLRRRGFAAAAQVVEAENAELIDVERPVGTCNL